MKPAAVLIAADGHIMLSGFEHAQCLNDQGGCVPFIVTTNKHPRAVGVHDAPEILLDWAHDFGVDWWGFGVVLFWMLTAEVCGAVIPGAGLC